MGAVAGCAPGRKIARKPITAAPVKRYFMLILLQVKKPKNL